VVEKMKTHEFKRALYVGRFQPFHLGHLKAIKDIVGNAEELVIAIGSAQYGYDPLNPFTGGERLTMIRLALNEAKVNPAKYLIVPVPDLHRPLVWVSWVVSLVGYIDVVFSNEAVTVRAFKEKGYRVEPITPYRQELYSGSEIRRRMREDEEWRDLVPKSVASYIESLDGVARIKDLCAKDNL
jgi:nicotinamide-nucleotide adenylyltransferase